MDFLNVLGLRISRLGIGTVQFGLDYGINNPKGKVPFSEILKIFDLAAQYGVNLIDTSRFYGTSEKNIGLALEKLGLRKSFVICTKLDISKNYKEKSDKEILKEVDDTLAKSLESLKVEKIPIYLLHLPEHRTFRDGLIWNFLQEKQSEGLIGHLGVSIAYGPKEALDALQDPVTEALQIPFNIFDQRWRNSGFFEEVNKISRELALFTRSSYLQGLLVMRMEDVPPELNAAKEYKHVLNEIAGELSMSVKELALRYVFSVESITSTIVGIDSSPQFEENLSIYNDGKLNPSVMRKIESAFQNIPENIVNPVFWKGEKERYEKKVSKEVGDESN